MKKALKFILCALVFCANFVQAEIRIVIDQGVDSAQPIAILPFSWKGAEAPPQNIGNIIAADLQNSGKFNPLAPEQQPQTIHSISEFDPSAWQALNINLIVMGGIQKESNGNYLVSYQLIDLAGTAQQVIASNQYRVTEQWLRYAAHTISDEVFEKILGIKGAFRTRIAYIATNPAKKFSHELRVADYDGYNQFMVHRATEPLMSPAWSPDGKQLAYVTFESGRSELVVQTLATGKVKKIATFPRHNGAPAFSPDGKKLAFALSKEGSLNLYVMDLMTNKIQQITYNRSNNTEPSWFPDGQHLAYTSDQAGRPQVYKVNINTGDSQRLTWEGSQSQNSEVAPDGSFIITVSVINGKQNLMKQDLMNGAVKVLTSTFLDETPSISPNGTMIIYSATQGLSNVLHLVSTDGRFKASIPATDGQVKFPVWSPYL